MKLIQCLIPHSTIHRRRAILERTLLLRTYEVEIREFGWRTEDLFITVGNGTSEKIAEALLSDANVISTSVMVGNPEVNVAAKIYYKSTEELYGLVERTRRMPNVTDVEWSEKVRVYDKRQDVMIGAVFENPSKHAKN
jgi:hypothetical protein